MWIQAKALVCLVVPCLSTLYVRRNGNGLTDADLLSAAREAGVRGAAAAVDSQHVKGSFLKVAGNKSHELRGETPEILEPWKDSGRAIQGSISATQEQELAQKITSDGYCGELRGLLNAAGGTRFFDSPGAFHAEAYLRKKMADLGLEVSVDRFSLQSASGSASSDLSSLHSLHFAAVGTKGARSPSGNVVGVLRGHDRPGEVVVIGAHYDSVNWEAIGREGGAVAHTAPAPGADDNGSGVSALLEMAKALASSGLRLSRTVVFVAFCCEEVGIYGSKYFVQKRLPQLGDVKVALVLDEIGFPGKEPGHHKKAIFETKGYTPNNYALVDTIATSAKREPGVAGFEVNFHGFGSDHIPFLSKGHPALLLIERDNTYVADHWAHSDRDTMEGQPGDPPHIDCGFGSSMARLALRTVLRYAAPSTVAPQATVLAAAGNNASGVQPWGVATKSRTHMLRKAPQNAKKVLLQEPRN